MAEMVPAGFALVPIEPTEQMLADFQRGFSQQLSLRHKHRFHPTAASAMSAEEAGLRAMLKGLGHPVKAMKAECRKRAAEKEAAEEFWYDLENAHAPEWGDHE